MQGFSQFLLLLFSVCSVPLWLTGPAGANPCGCALSPPTADEPRAGRRGYAAAAALRRSRSHEMMPGRMERKITSRMIFSMCLSTPGM